MIEIEIKKFTTNHGYIHVVDMDKDVDFYIESHWDNILFYQNEFNKLFEIK